MLKVEKLVRVVVKCSRKDCEARDSQEAKDRRRAIKTLRKRGWQFGQRIWCRDHVGGSHKRDFGKGRG